jgi:hypothetical protein
MWLRDPTARERGGGFLRGVSLALPIIAQRVMWLRRTTARERRMGSCEGDLSRSPFMEVSSFVS